MKRRAFLRSAASLPLLGGGIAAAAMVKSDPIQAAYLALCTAIEAEAAEVGATGWATFAVRKQGEPILNLSFFLSGGGLKVRQIEGARHVAASSPAGGTPHSTQTSGQF
ncbi:hypothetical protein [Leisingera daeponensis]|uniref:hypothetical protein n=1 Tax=Leisingera daeponensis TaxID=405746 RepID=UPI001C93BE02|nr:hypothetical protein [Leisingera daeponensis]MBY6056353.1 hypothetical protein [Leisingera daeponensis]